MAKASFSAYVLVKNLLKTGEKVHFSTKKSTTNFGLPFCFFLFPFFASKWLKYAVFALQKAKNVGRKRGLRHIYICGNLSLSLSLSPSPFLYVMMVAALLFLDPCPAIDPQE